MNILKWNIIVLILNTQFCNCNITSNNTKYPDINLNNYNGNLNLHHTIRNSEFGLLILHTNDMHSRILETTSSSSPFCKAEICYGGFARLKLVSERIRKMYEKRNWSVLFLNAGDNFQGSPFYNIHKWRTLSDLIPDLGFDVMSLGNHEFDDGVEFLVDYVLSIKSVTTVGCNLDISKHKLEKKIILNRSKIFTLQGRKVGVVGYLTPDTKSTGQTGNVTFRNEIDCLKIEVAHLKAKNVEIIIALGHSGYDMDKKIAAEVEGIDLVVGGHSHTFLWKGDGAPDKERINGDYPTWVERISNETGIKKVIRVPVVQAYAYTKYLGFLKMIFSKSSEVHDVSKSQLHLRSAIGNPILLSSDIYSEDLAMKEKILKWKIEVDKQCNKQVGRTAVPLEGDGSICRNRECRLGNVISDAFIYHGVQYNPHNEETLISFVHSGSIRSNINPPDGKIIYGDLLSALPFSNKLILVKIKGKFLYEIFEHSISGIENNLGRFLQVSGLKVKYDVKKPVGHRVKSINIVCKECPPDQYKPVIHTEEYEVVTVDNILNGKDDFTILKNNHYILVKYEVTDFEAVLNYLKANSPVSPKIQGRIEFVNEHY
ncbi:5'-nucleotidase-like isoform X1 [Lycorma delicatula]|uniref:5'-nucleotidase-like isoform X1 n=1 Tax=Lycorma delicatula TaxID=130591 RepID=UPI003F51A144